MKKTMVISFIAAAMLLILCTACHVAESHNEVLAQENTVNGGYTITDITDPVEVQSYIEQQGGEYTADIMAVHQVTFTDYTVNDITDPAEIKAYLESQGQEYNENITACLLYTSIQDDHNLRLHNMELPVGKIVTAFVENGLEVSEAHTCEESLEDYFKRVTGGEGIA